MTIEQMRAELGLGPELSDEAVVQAWAEFIAGPITGEPAVSLDEAKTHLRIDADQTDEDDLVSALILAAQEWVEGYTELVLSPRQITQTADSFGGYIDLNASPVRSITGISYLDATGDPQTLASGDYLAALSRRPVRIMAGLGGSWPRTADTAGAVTVTYEAGFAAVEEVPQALKQAILLLVGHWYKSREAMTPTASAADLPLGVSALCQRYRRMMV